jgi:hypothetical protein
MRKRLVSFGLFAMVLTGCGSSTSETTEPSIKSLDSIDTVMENYVRNELDGDTPKEKDDRIVFMCSQTREAMQNKTALLTSTLGEYVDEFKELNFNSLSFDEKFTSWTKACAKVIMERPELKVQFDKLSVENQAVSDKFQKQLDVLDKKANKLGGGSYREMLYAQNKLESLIEGGAQYSLTGQGRDVEDASCSPTTYSIWSQAEPSGTWYCYLYFLEGNEPYTINVSGSRWGGKADRGSSSGDFIEFKVSDDLNNWLEQR